MKKLLTLILLCPLIVLGQVDTTPTKKEPSKFSQGMKKIFKYSTFYAAMNGNNSISDGDLYSITPQGQLSYDKAQTPFDFSIAVGIRKRARFGYENRANIFYDGTEKSLSDASTVGKIKGFEYLAEIDYRRLLGENYLNQHYFLRYVNKHWLAKVEYLENNFTDITYFESSQRYRYNLNNKLSFNLGLVQRISAPYGYDPVEEWLIQNGYSDYTYLAQEEGYTYNPNDGNYYDPSGELVATSSAVFENTVIPTVISDYSREKRDEIPSQWCHSLILGADFYHYTKDFWVHTWVNVLPYHLDLNQDYSYHRFNDNKNWVDYGGGLIFGWRITKSLGIFLEGNYTKYWNREWHDFKIGANYIFLK